MQHVSRSGRPYPNIVHNVQSPSLKQTCLPYIKISRICRHSRQSVVSNPFSLWLVVESRMLYVNPMGITIICCSSLFYKRGYSQNPPPVPLQEAHRPAILKLRHRPTSVQDVPTCEPLARTDHEPKAHLCMLEPGNHGNLWHFFLCVKDKKVKAV